MKNMFDLSNKIVVIIGGNGHLSKHFNRAFLEHGATLYSCDINISSNKEIEDLAETYPGKFNLVKLDATKKSELQDLYDMIIEKEKRVDVLVNAVTMKGNDFYLPFEEVSQEGWEKGLLGNLTVVFLAVQIFIKNMKDRGNGSIINISSHYGLVGNDQRIYEGSNLHEIYVKDSPGIKRIYSHGVYNAAKGGLNNFTRYLAAYYGQNNIRINTISPGGVWNEGENEVFLKKYSEKVPLGRKAYPNEMNGALIYLASDASTYVTGHNLIVDGGYTIW